jgi:hypothetical protein
MKYGSHVVSHLPAAQKAAIFDLAYARRTSVSELVRGLISRELRKASRASKRAKGAA